MVHSEARKRAIDAVNNAPEGWVVTVQEPTRSLDANALLHAELQELKGHEWAGKPRSMEVWKLLMVSAHAVATGRGADVVPGLEGEFVNLRESTAQMSKSRMGSLIEYIKAWKALHER